MNKNFSDYSVLIAEDNPDSRALIVRILEELGFKVFWQVSGQDAFRWLNRHTVDLVISDIQMPDGDGLWLLSQIRRSGNRTPVILISGGVMVTVEEAQSLGANGFLQKPFKPIDLSTLISRVLLEKREYA